MFVRYSNKLKWDGSNLPDIRNKDILLRKTINSIKFCKIRLYDDEFWFAYHTSTNKLPCIIDEMKYLFGIQKTGTHSIKMNGRLCILYKINSIPLTRMTDHPNKRMILGKENITKEMETIVEEVRKIECFRYMFNLGMDGNSVIFIKTKPLSFMTKINLNNNEPAHFNLSGIQYIDFYMKSLLNNYIKLGHSNFYDEVEDIIMKIDPTLCYYMNDIQSACNSMYSLYVN